MRYRTGEIAHVGDRVNIRDRANSPVLGTVVFVIDNDEYAPAFPKADWSHYGRGLMVELDDHTLLMYGDLQDEHIEPVAAV